MPQAKKHKETAREDVDQDGFQLSEWPFYWLIRVVNLYVQHIDVALKRIDLDVPRWRVLMALGDGKVASVSEIAEQAISKLSTMTKVVQRMQADDLVRCNVRETDGRVTEVSLTERGLEARKLALDITNRAYTRAFGTTSDADVRHLNATLSHVFDALRN